MTVSHGKLLCEGGGIGGLAVNVHMAGSQMPCQIKLHTLENDIWEKHLCFIDRKDVHVVLYHVNG